MAADATHSTYIQDLLLIIITAIPHGHSQTRAREELS